MDDIIYINAENVIEVHNDLILLAEEFDNIKIKPGILSYDGIESAIGAYQWDYLPDIYSKAAALMRSLMFNHCFVDGNKRTAMLSTLIFLIMNGYHWDCNAHEAYKFIEWCCSTSEPKDKVLESIHQWIIEHTHEMPIEY